MSCAVTLHLLNYINLKWQHASKKKKKLFQTVVWEWRWYKPLPHSTMQNRNAEVVHSWKGENSLNTVSMVWTLCWQPREKKHAVITWCSIFVSFGIGSSSEVFCSHSFAFPYSSCLPIIFFYTNGQYSAPSHCSYIQYIRSGLIKSIHRLFTGLPV